MPMVRSVLSVLSFTTILAGCTSAGPAPAPSADDASSEPATVESPTPKPAVASESAVPSAAAGPARAKPFKLESQEDLEALFEREGCSLIAGDGSKVACLSLDLDMGFVDVTLDVFETVGGAPPKTYLLYDDGSTAFDEPKVMTKALAEVNAMLEQGAFIEGGNLLDEAAEKKIEIDSQVRLRGEKTSLIADAPPFIESDAPGDYSGQIAQCVSWAVASARRFEKAGVVVVRLVLSTKWTDESGDEKDPCFVKLSEELTDETRPSRDALVMLRAVESGE